MSFAARMSTCYGCIVNYVSYFLSDVADDSGFSIKYCVIGYQKAIIIITIATLSKGI